MTNCERVREFMLIFGQEVKEAPEFPDSKTVDLRVELIREEVDELLQGVYESRDVVEVADALTDILYVVYGMGHSFGIDLDACFEEVHLSNMSKLDEDGLPIYREDGKVQKGQNFFEPDLHNVLYR